MKGLILGIDTSAYTTSIAVAEAATGKIISDLRRVLSVGEGQKGLRQQEAVFQHLKNFIELYEQLDMDLSKINTVSVSSRPRNVEGSYMPVFTVGQNFGRAIARTLNAEYMEYSHQENHIGAALMEHYKEINRNILAIHISGGTTEFLHVNKLSKGYEAEIIGGTRDITLGQLIDRIGTCMGFPFPCGYHMEKYLHSNTDIEKIKYPSIAKSQFINLSGMENYYKNLYTSNKYNKASIVCSLFEYASSCILNITEQLQNQYKFDAIIVTGGVASNSIVRNKMTDRFGSEVKLVFPSISNSSDNAVGSAYLPIIDRWYS